MDISKTMGNVTMFLRRESPRLLTFGGAAGAVAAGVMACAATYRHLHVVLADHCARVEDARGEEDSKALTQAYLRTGGELAKVYAPSVTVGTLSIASILMGNRIQHQRTLALAAAYTTVDRTFRDYRDRVVERFGEDVDRELRYKLAHEKVEETVTDENGKKKKVKRDIVVADADASSGYARYFAQGDARAAEPNDDYNLFFLRAQQELANNMLRAKGFLFLNDIYEMLGIEPSVPGQLVGWIYDKNGEEPGDNYIDLRIQEVYRSRSDEPGDYEKVLLIDPNVDGTILQRASEKGLVTQ